MRDGSGSASEFDDGRPADPRAPDRSLDAAYRGFLFADLRGFTAFVESRGEKAAADLLDIYRSLVREQVARHAGAEIRTEGDSFYVVFPSARAAVACGLGITAATEQDLELHPERPIHVGIGINAGEATQRGEGFVGTAVNLAARVCSQARAGEVLVTGTVRDAVRGTSELRFVSRGSRRLKGIAESVPLFAVEAAGSPTRRSGPRWLPPRRLDRGAAVAGLGAAVAAIALGLALGRGLLGGAGDGSSATSPSALAASPASTIGSSASPTDAATTVADTFPNPDEAALMTRVGVNAEDCDRADLDDRPRLSIDPGTAELFGVGTTRLPLAVAAGVACTIASAAAPSRVEYWATGQVLDYGAADTPAALILSDSGTFDVPDGDCAVGQPAFSRWSFGGTEGWVLCRELYGDAMLEWTYDGRPIVAIASRRDGDHARLYAWWRDNARFLNN